MIDGKQYSGSLNPLTKIKEQRKLKQIQPTEIYYDKIGKSIPKSYITRIRYNGYKTTNRDIDECLKNFNNQCEICKDKIQGRTVTFDHNHTTNEFRGIICQKCNTLLANAKDNILILKQAIKYLETNS